MSTATPRPPSADEHTPLLHSASPSPAQHDAGPDQDPAAAEEADENDAGGGDDNDDDLPVSFSRLVVIMSAGWTGVFLAALGKTSHRVTLPLAC